MVFVMFSAFLQMKYFGCDKEVNHNGACIDYGSDQRRGHQCRIQADFFCAHREDAAE